jgi:peptidoglycan hydrolase-like protein with peptidoglycan-binding domain
MKQNPLLITGSVFVAAWMTTGAATAQTSQGQTVHPSPNSSVGASKSERSGDTGTPLPKGSSQSGTVDMGKSGSTDSGSNAVGSQRANGSYSSRSSAMSHRASTSNIKEAQQALKDKGYDPGPIDGVMGSHTREAIKSFQNASNLQATGTLDAETAEKLGIQSSGSSSSTRSSDNMKSSNTTGDQPNQSSSKNR